MLARRSRGLHEKVAGPEPGRTPQHPLPEPVATAAGRQGATEDVVTSVVGSQDEVAGPVPAKAYVDALVKHGVKARLVIVSGAGHDILISRPVFKELAVFINEFDGTMPRPHPSSAAH